MIDFASKVFNNFFINEIKKIDRETRKKWNVLHIGDTNIQDWNSIKTLLDYEDIHERPKDMYEMYRYLGFLHVDIVNINNFEDWSQDNKKYDFIFNCHSSDVFLDQIKFHETLNDITKDQSQILHVVPYYSPFEMGFYSFNPAFFAKMASHFNYAIKHSYIGSQSLASLQKIEIVNEIARERYAQRHFLDIKPTADKGLVGAVFISVVFEKGIIDVQEND